MPDMADITVKKYDGTTDITYTKKVASGGDKSPAIWRSTTVGTASGHQPELRVTSRPNGPNSGRRVDVAYSYPSLVTGSDGRINIADRFNGTASFIVPLGMLTVDLREAAYQVANLMASSLMKSMVNDGFAAT